jgi:photosystem II stability/assembly factor-like uncharacterized protein
VHGLGINPGDGRLYVAAHSGVYEVVDGQPKLISDRAQDTMGFDITGEDSFIASGHPATAEEVNPLGFITSDDAARTWTSVSLAGVADLHAIDVADDGSIVAYDSTRGLLIRSTDDGRTWDVLQKNVSLIDIAAQRGQKFTVLASTSDGRTLSVDAAGTSTPLTNSPGLTFLDVTINGTVVGLGVDGRIWVQRGTNWTSPAQVEGTPEAISVAADTWYVATSAGIVASDDGGTTWTNVLR